MYISEDSDSIQYRHIMIKKTYTYIKYTHTPTKEETYITSTSVGKHHRFN